MTLSELITRVRSYTRDTTGTLFSASDVKDFINEAIHRVRFVKELRGMKQLVNDTDEPILLPSQYHFMLAVYSASRCFAQDEQQYFAQVYMDEFLNTLTIIELGIQDGSIVITDENNQVVKDDTELDGVTNTYFTV